MKALQIRQERKNKGWSTEYVAQKIHTTPSTVQKIETGQRKPSFDVLVRLLKLFGYGKTAQTVEQLFAVVDDT